MVAHLASLAEERLIISFAPNTLAYSILKRIGELFPGPSKVRSAEDVVGQTVAMMRWGGISPEAVKPYWFGVFQTASCFAHAGAALR